MKRRTKIGLSLAAVAFGAVALSGCTKSFCSQVDTARMKFAFEPGISTIVEGTSSIDFKSGEFTYRIENAQYVVGTWVKINETDEHIGRFELQYTNAQGEEVAFKLRYLNSIIKNSRSNGYVTIDGYTTEYLARFDYLAYHSIFSKVLQKNEMNEKRMVGDTITVDLATDEGKAQFDRDVSYYSYLRFAQGNTGGAWKNWNQFDSLARKEITSESPLYNTGLEYFNNSGALSADLCPSTDFVKYYKSQLNSFVSAYRTCLTTKTDRYGSYGYSAEEGVFINKKTWGEAWNKGLFEGLLVFPIGALVDAIVLGFKGTGASNGVAAFLGIVFVTFIIRALMLLLTFKQTQSNAKMTELQPEIQKIQNKYPNSNTSQVEKQRMAEEMNRLYKKNKVNPFMTIIVLIVQFPIFICVWGALSGSAQLTNGTILGLNLSLTIREVLMNGSYWTAAGGYAAVTALFLFLLMAGAQTISMLLPQWIQKRNAKNVAKLGKNPAQQSQNNKMKWFTYIMLALIIFMGFSLVSAMGIYWFIGAIFSIIQTLIMQVINDKKKAKKN